MNVLTKTVVAVAAIAVAVPLPAQAASVLTTNQNAGGTIATSAYGIDGLVVGTNSYDVRFNYGSFSALYGNPVPSSAYAGSLASDLGNAIVAELQALGIQQVVSDNLTDFGTHVLSEFFIPQSEMGQNPNQALFAHCFTTQASPACNDENRDPSQNDSVLFAQFTTAAAPAPIPTPALLPGLLGMGATILRRRKQSA